MASNPPNMAASSSVKSAIRTLDIIEFVVAAGRPLVAQEISTALGIPVSSLSYLLATLVERTYLARNGRRYTPGPGLERLQARDGGFSLADRVTPLVRSVRMQLNETTSFFVQDGWEIEALVTETSDQALRYAIDIGNHLPMNALASGKALLAAMPEEEFERFLGSGPLRSFTPATVTSKAELRRQVAAIRKSGFAMTDEELTPGINGIGCVVRMGGEVVGALSIAVPKVRCDAALIARAKDQLSRAAALLDAG